MQACLHSAGTCSVYSAAWGFLSECLQHCWSPAFSWLQKGFLGAGVELNIIVLVDVLTPPASKACGFYAEKTEAS